MFQTQSFVPYRNETTISKASHAIREGEPLLDCDFDKARSCKRIRQKNRTDGTVQVLSVLFSLHFILCYSFCTVAGTKQGRSSALPTV